MFRTSALLVVSSTAASAVATSVELEGASASVVLDVDGTSPVIVNKAYLDALATDAEVASAVAPLATSAEVASAVAPLATSAEVAAAVAPLATSAEVASAVAPLATSAEVASAVAPLATSAEVDSKIEAYDTRNNDCPNGSLDSYGVCIWHVGTYDKNVVEAEAACAAVEGGRLCYTSEVWQAWEKGAQWCSNGWTENDPSSVSDRFSYDKIGGFKSTDGVANTRTFRTMYPMQNAQSGCGSKVAVIGGSGFHSSNPEGKAGANCCIDTAKQKARSNEVVVASLMADNHDCPHGSLDAWGVCIWHIGTYDKNVAEAKAACAAQAEGGRLCTVSEVWQAWEKGAQWCSSGWTENDPSFVSDRFSYDQLDGFKSTVGTTTERTYRTMYPMQNAQSGCGSKVAVIGGSGFHSSNPEGKAGANCCVDTGKQKARSNEIQLAALNVNTMAGRCPNDSYKKGQCAWHIGGYDKTAEAAKAACAAQVEGGRLCTVGEMWHVWDNGYEWCSNGWTQNDMVDSQPKHATRFTRDANGEYTNTAPVLTYRATYPMQRSINGCSAQISLVGGTGSHASNPDNLYGANCCL